MVFYDNFVVVVQTTKGKTLRDRPVGSSRCHEVLIPPGTEYQILLKNLDSRRAQVTITIDNQDVLDGSSIVVNGKSQTVLEGFMKGNRVTHRFRSITKTKEIAEHRGDRVDDGIIRVEVAYEKPKPVRTTIRRTIHRSGWWWPYDWYWYPSHPVLEETVEEHPVYRSLNVTSHVSPADRLVGCSLKSSVTYSNNAPIGASVVNCYNASLGNTVQDTPSEVGEPDPDEVITVKGSESDQIFGYTSIGALEESFTITIKLRGLIGDDIEIPVEKPVLTRDKLICETCGRKHPSSYKFCPNCSTALI